MVALALVVGLNSAAHAEWQQSSNYGMNESEVGTVGDFSGASANYSMIPGVDDSGSTLGENAVGDSASASYQSSGGFNTTAQPGLTLVVNTSSVNFGTLSSGAATFRTATFDVTNYTSYGYVAQLVGTAPTYNGHQLAPLTTDTASSAGNEQFGVNTVNNPVAGSGADPAAPPNGINSQGVAGDGITGTYGTTRPYTVPDKYRFVSGETIASAPKSSGATRYTMTLLANISTVNTPVTPGSSGYVGNLQILVTGTY